MAVNIVIELVHNLLARADHGVVVDSCQVTMIRGRTRSKAMVYRANIEGTTTRGARTISCSRSLVCKCLLASETRTMAGLLFKNELAVYTKVLPTLLAFQASCGQRVTLPFQGVPACYFARSDRLVLEDLQESGYKMAAGLDHAHCAVAVRHLARFHALSLAMKRRYPQRFLALVTSFAHAAGQGEWYRNHYSHTDAHALSKGELVTTQLDCNSRYRLDQIKSLTDSGSNFCEMVPCAINREPMGVFCHGDYSPDNFLFSYSTEGDILEMRFVGFQRARYASLVVDLFSLFYSCSSQEPKGDCLHQQQLLREYHAALSTQLKQLLAGAPQNILSHEDGLLNPDELWKMLLHEFRRCGFFGIALAQVVETPNRN